MARKRVKSAAILGGLCVRVGRDLRPCCRNMVSSGSPLKREHRKPLVEPRVPQFAQSAEKDEPRNRRRSERVLLQVAVIIGMKTPEGNEISQDGYTLAVNAHGGLLETGLRVQAGQEVFLANPRTGTREPCRVLHVRRSGGAAFAVTFEFERRAAQFWPILFPPGDWAADE